MRDASSVDQSRRTLLLTAPLALSAVVLAACQGSAPSPTVGDLARALDERLASRDHAGFLALFAPQPGPQALGRRIYSNLAPSAGPRRRPTTVGATVAGRLRVQWSLPLEAAVVSEASPTLHDGLIADLTAASTGTEWLDEPLSVSADEAKQTVLAASDAVLDRWRTAATAGREALLKVTPTGHTWAEPLVVLVPGSLIGFERYARAGGQEIAAVTVVPGTSDSAGFRVVVNPVTPNDPDADAATLTHEAVHAGMASPRLTRTPGWLLEGIAETLTANAHPKVAAANQKLARAAIVESMPLTLPDTDSTQPSSYALAQVAVEAMVAQVGWAAVFDEARGRSNGGGRLDDQQILGWYRDALARLV